MLSRFHFITVIILLLTKSVLYAQVSVSIAQPPQSTINFNGLWNIEVINTSAEKADITLVATLGYTNNVILSTIKFNKVILPVGPSYFPSGVLPIESIKYSAHQQAGIIQQSGLLPFGNYVLCIQAFNALNGALLSDYCTEYVVEPFTPPFLLMPTDDSKITITNPLLMWIAPSPISSLKDLHYELKLVEIIGNQSPEEAISRNYALLEKKGISVNQLLYPADAHPLEINKSYAWQVKARNNNAIIGTTEVWNFTIGRDSIVRSSLQINDDSYNELKTSLDGSFTIAVPELRFAYHNPYSNSRITYKITDLAGKEAGENSDELESVYGDNRYMLELGEVKKLKSGSFYILEVTNIKGIKNYLMFQYYKSEAHYQKRSK